MDIASYEKDFVMWSEQQAQFLKEKKFESLDIDNIVDEIESLGKRDKFKIECLLTRLFETKLKRKHTLKDECYRGWDIEVVHLEAEIKDLLDDSPSLCNYLHEISFECYKDALRQVNIIYEFYDFSRGLDTEEIVNNLIA